MITLHSRSVLRLTGGDRASFLQGMITQDVGRIDDAGWYWAGFLNPQGKLWCDVLISTHDDAFVIDCPRERRDDLLKRILFYKLRADVRCEVMHENVCAGWSGAVVPPARPDMRHPALGWRAIGLSGRNHGDEGLYHHHRWSLGIAEGPAELGVEDLLWLECNADLLNGVSFSKGCYIGQENTTRMHHRGKVQKRVMFFLSSGEGAAIECAGRSAGKVLCRMQDRGIALLRLEYAAMPLTLGGEPASLLWPEWLLPVKNTTTLDSGKEHAPAV